MNSNDLRDEPERRVRVEEALIQGEALRKAKEYERAIDVLVEALQYGVDKAKIYFRLGNVYFDAGKLDHAEYAYRRAIDAEPTYVNARYNLSVVVRRQGKISEAIRLRRQAERLAMRNPERIQLTVEQTERARELARRWLIGIGLVLVMIVLGLMALSRL